MNTTLSGDFDQHLTPGPVRSGDSTLNAPARLAALRRTGLLGFADDRPFDRLTRLVSRLLRAPVSLVSLVDENRAALRGRVGLCEPWAARREIPLSHSFCRHVVENGTPLIIENAASHELVRGNPAIGELGFAAYAGIPLRDGDGHVLGVFCVIDHQPRVWKPGEIGVLSELAESVLSEIALQARTAGRQALLDRFSQWCDRMPVACFTCGADMRIADWNPAAARVFGHTADVAAGRVPHELLFSPSQTTGADALFSKAASRADFRREGVECVAADGRTLITDWTFMPLVQPCGANGGFVAMVQDATARHRAENERAESEARLVQRHKLESLGTLAAGMAHEVGNFLGAILGNAEAARRETAADHPAAGALDEILAASLRARDVVGNVLSHVRNRPANPRVFAPAPVAEECVRFVRSMLGRDVCLTVHAAADTPDILGDATQVGQVILDLVTNAWHSLHGRSGGIGISLDAVTDAPGLAPGRYARIIVHDTGEGMDEKTMARIFEPFFTTKPDGKGTGLGLPIVRDIMRAHRGAVFVSSQPGRGSDFTLYFPAAAQPPATNAEKPVRPCVWMLDDESPIVAANTRMLRHAGFEVSAFTDAVQALRAFHAKPDDFSVALIDANLSRVSGIEVAAKLRALRPELPVVLTSGHVSDELREAGIRAGIRHTLEKPHTLRELEAALRAAIAGQGPV